MKSMLLNILIALAAIVVVFLVIAAPSEGGQVAMPLAKTFWSPLFGMLTDRFGVNWMITLPI